nr:hypothetical protein [Oscillospiraceae bacterium]
MTAAVDEQYMQAYMKGYMEGIKAERGEAEKPYLNVEDVRARYGGIGKPKAFDIMNAVRHYCNGGKLNHNGMILRSELEYWESIVEKRYIERLGDNRKTR